MKFALRPMYSVFRALRHVIGGIDLVIVHIRSPHEHARFAE